MSMIVFRMTDREDTDRHMELSWLRGDDDEDYEILTEHQVPTDVFDRLSAAYEIMKN